ncbi:hypothetical protein [Microbacterium sp. No. 7]|uniref:hypothetical protein n=1 Tax=Microbacterium sp. No. 7 TaxID=1714373 RepID=UPI0006D00F12|nr:hypothetical protein [Microbacterium sp. No. 7]ALJ18716.1 hypothetical protein AOA12_01830 [Microbacterium sp. No. 7]
MIDVLSLMNPVLLTVARLQLQAAHDELTVVQTRIRAIGDETAWRAQAAEAYRGALATLTARIDDLVRTVAICDAVIDDELRRSALPAVAP